MKTNRMQHFSNTHLKGTIITKKVASRTFLVDVSPVSHPLFPCKSKIYIIKTSAKQPAFMAFCTLIKRILYLLKHKKGVFNPYICTFSTYEPCIFTAKSVTPNVTPNTYFRFEF